MKNRKKTATSMVMELLDSNPKITTKDVVAAMAKKGRNISVQSCYGIKTKWNKKIPAGVPQIKAKKKVVKKSQPIVDSNVEIEILRRDVRRFKDIVMRLLMD